MRSISAGILTLGAFLGTASLSSAANPQLLASVPIFAGVNGVAGYWSDVDLGLYYPNSALLSAVVAPSGTSQTFSWSDSTPGFSAMTALMTDGIDENINCYESGMWSGNSESAWLTGIFGTSQSKNGIDLQGFNISRIDMRVDSMSLVSPGRDPLGNGIWTDVNISGNFLIYGTPVPEPASFTLFGLGSFAFVMMRRRNARVRQSLQN